MADSWRNCLICMACGRCRIDEDGCCATCGRDCLMFDDGKLANGALIDNVEADIRNQTAAAIATWLDEAIANVLFHGGPNLAVSEAIRAGAWRTK